jgi:hypothetical protein
MARFFLLLVVLQAMTVSTARAQTSLTLEVDGQQFGAFKRLNQDAAPAGTVTLEQGWITTALLDLWWPEQAADLAPGLHRFPGECEGRRLEVRQVLAGARGRTRSWTLIDACPLSCTVKTLEGDRVNVTEFTLRIRGVGAAL